MTIELAVRRACVACCLVLASVFVLAAPPPQEPGFELRRGVFVDGAAAYLAAPQGGIAAVDLASGRTLWTSELDAVPVALLGTLLVTQVEEIPAQQRLRVVILDTAARGRKVAEATIPLPEDVIAIVEDQLERTFRVRAQRDGTGILVSWQFAYRDVKGARIEGQTLFERIVDGAAHIDLATGRAVVLPARAPKANAFAADPDERWRAGAVLARTEGGRGGPLVLERWNASTGAKLPDLQLLRHAIASLPSADRAHVLGAERASAGGTQDPEYRWSIFSVETGALLGELRRESSAAPFVVADGNVVFETPRNGIRHGEEWLIEPLKIRGVRLSTGVTVWDHEIRELRYRGPVPPGGAKTKTTPSPARPERRNP